MKLKYPYSSELKPAAMNTDYDMAELKSPLVKRVFAHRYDVIRKYLT